MKKYYMLTALLITVSFYLAAQTPPSIQWQKSLGGSQSEYYGIIGFEGSIQQTSDGGYLVSSSSNSNDGDVSGNHSASDGWLVKLDGSGVVQWQKSLGGSMDDVIYSVEQTTDGGYILAGFSHSSDGDLTANHGDSDAWVVKLNSNGSIQWQKNYGGSQVDVAASIRQTSEGGYIIAGTTASDDGDVSGNHGGLDYWIIKLNDAGNIQWQKCLGGSDLYPTGDEASSIIQSSDGGYIVTGFVSSNDGDVTGYHGTYEPDYWVVKLDGNGVIQWQKCLGGTESDIAWSAQQTSDGGYIIAGTTGSNDGDLSGGNYADYDFDYWVVQLSSTGAIQWQKRYGGSGADYGQSIKQTSDGGYIMAGYSGSNDRDVSGNHQDASGNSLDYWVIKLNSIGLIQWQKCFGGSDVEQGYSIYPTSDKGYIVAGLTYSNDGDVSNNHGNGDLWVVKLSPDALLPVTLLNFSGEANGKQNLLHWTTATEINNIGFEVQRSSDANKFKKIGFANTASINGNSTGNLHYDFTDISYSSATNYYRLKQIDKNGKFSYSNIVVLKHNNAYEPGLLAVYPIPAKNTLNVKIASPVDTNITLQLTDVAGKPVVHKVTHVNSGESIVQLDLAHLSAGSYFIKLVCSNGCENAVMKFVKQ